MNIFGKMKLMGTVALTAAALSTGGARAADEIKIGMVNLSLCCAYFVGMDAAVKDEAKTYELAAVGRTTGDMPTASRNAVQK